MGASPTGTGGKGRRKARIEVPWVLRMESARERAGFDTLKELAERIDPESADSWRSYLNACRRNKIKEPSHDRLEKIAGALGVSVEYLWAGKDAPAAPAADLEPFDDPLPERAEMHAMALSMAQTAEERRIVIAAIRSHRQHNYYSGKPSAAQLKNEFERRLALASMTSDAMDRALRSDDEARAILDVGINTPEDPE